LAAELYVRFRSLLASYDPDRGVPLRPYLVRMLIVSAYSSERQRWRRAAREVSLERLGAETDVALIPANDPVSDWVEHLHVERVLLQLSQALRQLPDRQRQVVVWRYYEGRSFEEIAAALQIRPATARSLLRHGVNRLRGLLWQCRE
jgi:RNA polymerase sigma factor (sigma-70 family)